MMYPGEARQPSAVPAYSTSAGFYDHMVGRYAFEHWRENFERLEKRHGFRIEVVADAACGTGLEAGYFMHRGAMVFASDLSEHMLKESAASYVSRRISHMKQDMRYLQPPEKVTLVNCATDSMNHLLDEADISRALESFRAALIPGGHAIFDMNTAWQLRQGSDKEAWEFEVSGQNMRWLSAWDESSMTSTLSMVFLDTGDGGGDVMEVHRERAYDAGWILGELERAGFKRAEALDAAGLGKPSGQTRRLQFVAVR